jgi:polar amino acid transport system substrate-binding protein
MDEGMTSMRRFLAICLALLCFNAAGQDVKPPPAMPAGTQKAAGCDQAADVLSRVICTKTLKVGVRTGYPPFAFEDAGVLQGFEIDLARQLAGSLGVTPAFVVVTPANRLAMLGEGRVDMVIATMGHTLQRDREAVFVRPHYYQSQTIVLGAKSLRSAAWSSCAATPSA